MQRKRHLQLWPPGFVSVIRGLSGKYPGRDLAVPFSCTAFLFVELPQTSILKLQTSMDKLPTIVVASTSTIPPQLPQILQLPPPLSQISRTEQQQEQEQREEPDRLEANEVETSGGSGSGGKKVITATVISTEYIQQILEENEVLLQAAMENYQCGRVKQCFKFQQRIQANLINITQLVRESSRPENA